MSLSDRALSRLLRIGTLVLIIGIPLFGVVYFLDQRVSPGPSLDQRQVITAEAQVRKSPNNVAARLALAAAYRQDKRLDDALRQYDEILRVEPTHRAALLGRGEILYIKGDLAAAAATLQKITSAAATGEFAGADPQLEEAHYYLGAIAVKQDNGQTATAELSAALKIDGTDADAWYLLGTVQLKDGQAKNAVRSLRQALLYVPTGWCDPYGQLGAAYRNLGQLPQAEYAGAMLDFCQNRTVEAINRLKALAGGPEAVDAMLGLGMIAETGNNRDEAISWYRKVLAVNAGNTTAISALSRLGAAPAGSATPSPAGSGSATAGNN